MGINVGSITICGFLITGFLSSLSGILYASRLASASPLAGTGFDLDSAHYILKNNLSIPISIRNQLLVQGAGIVLDPARGHILAMIGGREENEYNEYD